MDESSPWGLHRLAAAKEVRLHLLDHLHQWARGLDSLLGCPELSRRDHLHRLGDLTRILDAFDPVF